MTGEILRILEEEEKIFSNLIEVYKKKQKAIIENSIDVIKSSIGEETKLLESASTLSKQRERAIIAFMKEKKVQGRFRLETVIKNVSDEDGKIFIEKRDALVEQFKELKALNDLNRVMVEDNLSCLKYTLELFSGENSEDKNTYSHLDPMKKNQKRKKPSLDRKG